MKTKAGQTVLSVTGNRMFRMNKDGTLDQRYALGRRYARYDAEQGIVTKKIRKQAKKRRRVTRERKFWDRVTSWLTLLAIVIFSIWATYMGLQGEGNREATLFKAVVAEENPTVDYQVSGKKAYLENPQTLEEIKDYMRFKFGKNYQVACMVAYGESLRSPMAVARNPLETSAGIFHINIIDGSGNKVHWDKIPGETEQDKIDWLQVPKNAIDLAYKMSDKGTDWYQWGAFTNNSYLRFREECK